MSAITLDTISAGRLRETGHMNYGKDGFGYPMQHTTIARLSCIDRYYKGKAREKAGVASERLWQVDGQCVADLDEAVAKLNVPPAFTVAERAFLDKVPATWTELKPLLDLLDGEIAGPASAHELMFACRSKGAVEVERRDRVSFIRSAPPEEARS